MSDEFAERLLDETRHEIDRADAKASILFAGAGIATGALIAGMVGGDIDPTDVRGAVQVVGTVAAVLVTVGVACLAAAVFPRLGRAEFGRARYFMDIAAYETVPDLREAVAKEAVDCEDRHLQQLHRLSRIVKAKYRLTRWGESMTGIGLMFAAAAGLLHLALKS